MLVLALLAVVFCPAVALLAVAPVPVVSEAAWWLVAMILFVRDASDGSMTVLRNTDHASTSPPTLARNSQTRTAGGHH